MSEAQVLDKCFAQTFSAQAAFELYTSAVFIVSNVPTMHAFQENALTFVFDDSKNVLLRYFFPNLTIFRSNINFRSPKI